MSETQEVQELYPGLIVGKDGKPFDNVKAAKASMNGKGIKSYDVVTVEGGFAVKVEKYYKVRFHAKASPNDPEDVQLSVNGDTLIIAREKDVIIPERFKECADHATYPQFRQLPGETRKIVGRIRVFPYDLLGEATEQAYHKQREEGTRKTKEIIAIHGHDVDPNKLQAQA
jgi:hypothetical protein